MKATSFNTKATNLHPIRCNFCLKLHRMGYLFNDEVVCCHACLEELRGLLKIIGPNIVYSKDKYTDEEN